MEILEDANYSKTSGELSGEFLILYAISRIFNEIFREPDAPLVAGLSRGQFYYIPNPWWNFNYPLVEKKGNSLTLFELNGVVHCKP